jgi:hypothetical protein
LIFNFEEVLSSVFILVVVSFSRLASDMMLKVREILLAAVLNVCNIWPLSEWARNYWKMLKPFLKLEPIRTIFYSSAEIRLESLPSEKGKTMGQPVHTVCASSPSILASLIPSRPFLHLLSNGRYHDKKLGGGGGDAFDLQLPACASSETGLARSYSRPWIGCARMLEKNRFSS